jgi:hypothetical protein
MRTARLTIVLSVIAASGCSKHAGENQTPVAQIRPAVGPPEKPALLDQAGAHDVGMYDMFAEMDCEIAAKPLEQGVPLHDASPSRPISRTTRRPLLLWPPFRVRSKR